MSLNALSSGMSYILHIVVWYTTSCCCMIHYILHIVVWYTTSYCCVIHYIILLYDTLHFTYCCMIHYINIAHPASVCISHPAPSSYLQASLLPLQARHAYIATPGTPILRLARSPAGKCKILEIMLATLRGLLLHWITSLSAFMHLQKQCTQCWCICLPAWPTLGWQQCTFFSA